MLTRQAVTQRIYQAREWMCTINSKVHHRVIRAAMSKWSKLTRELRSTTGFSYGWFTEGFDTLDLKEAKALLEELAA